MTDLAYLRTFGCEAAGCTDPAWAERGVHAPNCVQDEFNIALDEVDRLEAENERLRHIARRAADFRDQIHPDVNWDRVPPWTMDVVREFDRLLAAFDEEEDARDGELP